MTVTSVSIPAFAYGNIQGPGNTPVGKTNQEWGAEQADALSNQYWNQQYPGGYCGNTLFGSEPLGNGWYFTIIGRYYQSAGHDVTPYSGGVDSTSNYTWHPVAPPGIC